MRAELQEQHAEISGKEVDGLCLLIKHCRIGKCYNSKKCRVTFVLAEAKEPSFLKALTSCGGEAKQGQPPRGGLEVEVEEMLKWLGKD